MTKLRGLVLDLDGTVADSIGLLCDLTYEIFDSAELARPERRALLDAMADGLPPSRLLPADFVEPDRFLERLYKERWAEWLARYGNDVGPLEGACETLTALHRRGLSLALVTSSPGELPFLERWGIRRLFDVVIGRDQVKNVKPDPEPMLAALAALRLDAGAVLGVGDSPLDVRAARAAGFGTIGVLTGVGTERHLREAGAVAVIPAITALPDFLDSAIPDTAAFEGGEEPV